MSTSVRPNILLILTDQQRGDCLGIDGHPVLETPNLDYLGRSGAHFRRAYSECPHCMPARRSLITGQSPATHGLLRNAGKGDWNPPHTLSGELRRAGYQTEMVGKLHVGPPRKRYGFDHLVLADATRGANDYVEWLTTHGGAPAEAPVDRWAMAHGVTPNGWLGRPTHLPETQTLSFWCATEAIKFLARRDPSVPFYLNVSFVVRPPREWGYPMGRTVDAPVGLQDVMPTLLEAAGATIPETVTGRSVLPLMREEGHGWREALHGECAGRYADYGAMHYLLDKWK